MKYIHSHRQISYAFLLGCLLLACQACSENNARQAEKEGEQLARTHCGGCHQFPAPALLDKATWRSSVLPLMALQLGVHDSASSHLSAEGRNQLLLEGSYPSQPVISEAQWEQIKAFYGTHAPDTLPPQNRKKVINTTSQFVVKTTAVTHARKPAVTFVKINPETQQVYAADDAAKQLLMLNASGNLQQAIPQKTAVSYVDFVKHPTSNNSTEALITHIGFSINPTASRMGYVEWIRFGSTNEVSSEILINSLHRPTQVKAVDLANDAVDELVACNYGHQTGSLSVWKRTEAGTYEETVISQSPGVLQVLPYDVNGDQLLDLIVLFAQGDERIVWFRNNGDSTFSEKPLLRFPPVYGSSYFEIADFNGDNQPDILYTCGDNADYSMELKPYHGVYIFLNTGNFTFRQTFFFPLNGAYKAVARDFDVDGDLDITAISFFADYKNQPEEGFVYLENQSVLTFKPHTVPVHQLGRWMTMDAGDIDGDGDTDIALGSYTTAPDFMTRNENWAKNPGVVYLLNTKFP